MASKASNHHWALNGKAVLLEKLYFTDTRRNVSGNHYVNAEFPSEYRWSNKEDECVYTDSLFAPRLTECLAWMTDLLTYRLI